MSFISDIQADSFEQEVKSIAGPVVLEFWVRSCSQCKKFKPVYERLQKVFGKRVRFLRMNMLKSIENLWLAENMGVEETPNTKIFCKGIEVGELIGYIPFEKAVEKIEEFLNKEEICH